MQFNSFYDSGRYVNQLPSNGTPIRPCTWILPLLRTIAPVLDQPTATPAQVLKDGLRQAKTVLKRNSTAL